jgi:peptidoglycan/xylan/chitin deacetylase (PgdA/CDA1 family)
MRFLLLLALAACAGMLGSASPARAGAPEFAGVPVLMYHKVDPKTPRDAVGRSLTLEPEAFDEELAWLRAHAIRTLTMNELADALARGEHPRNAVVLTFDDGYNDAADVVTPILRKYGARASFYVSAGFIGDGRHASWAKLRAMHAEGMEIGCHGTHHLDLVKIRPSEASVEVNHCVAALTHYLARPTTYAYAAGEWNATTLALMRLAGMKAALTEHYGTVTALTSPYTLPRRRIDRTTGIASFAALATP